MNLAAFLFRPAASWAFPILLMSIRRTATAARSRLALSNQIIHLNKHTPGQIVGFRDQRNGTVVILRALLHHRACDRRIWVDEPSVDEWDAC